MNFLISFAPVGSFCHHISGECVRCGADRWGVSCSQQCDCSAPGTALCSHTTGRCYCQANWFGPRCQFRCPFGWEDGQCRTQAGLIKRFV